MQMVATCFSEVIIMRINGGGRWGGGQRSAVLVPSLGCAARLAEDAEGKQARRC